MLFILFAVIAARGGSMSQQELVDTQELVVKLGGTRRMGNRINV